jgi:hypothetical protein
MKLISKIWKENFDEEFNKNKNLKCTNHDMVAIKWMRESTWRPPGKCWKKLGGH